MKGYCSQVVCPCYTLVLHALRLRFLTLWREILLRFIHDILQFCHVCKTNGSKQPFRFSIGACMHFTCKPHLMCGDGKKAVGQGKKEKNLWEPRVMPFLVEPL